MESRYRILSSIGRGGMGTVYLAEDLKLQGKRWAIKEMWTPVNGGAPFLAEAAMLSRLNHPLLPVLADYFPPDEQGRCYLVMEYIAGTTLDARFRECPEAGWREAVRVAEQLCDVFDYLHGQKPNPVIYRDLKPSNVLVDRQWGIRLIDFGIARHYDEARTEDTLVLGTPGFAAPEQYQGRQTDARTDLYALGALLFYILSGGLHFDSAHGQQREKVAASVPFPLATLMAGLLEPNPDRRPQTAAEVREVLASLLRPAAANLPSAQTGAGKPPAVRRLCLIGSLYPGAGATFASIALAATLAEAGVRTACLEVPGTERELAVLLNAQGSKEQDSIEWVPAVVDDAKPIGRETVDAFVMGLNRKPQSVIIGDMGGSWRNPDYSVLLDHADVILIVCGPNPAKLGRASSERAWSEWVRLKESGYPVYLIANGDSEFRGRTEWLRSLPDKPLCCLPQLSPGSMLEAEWAGRMFPDDPSARAAMVEAWKPLLKQLLPGGTPELRIKSGWLSKWSAGKRNS